MVKTLTIDCARLSCRTAAHDYLARMLELPAWYGRNLDALFDCLTERSGYELVLTGAETLRAAGGYGALILETIEEAAAANPGLTVREEGSPP